MLDRACTLVSSKLESSISESVLDMSIDLSSSEKTKIQDISKDEEEPDEIIYKYTEPQYRKVSIFEYHYHKFYTNALFGLSTFMTTCSRPSTIIDLIRIIWKNK